MGGLPKMASENAAARCCGEQSKAERVSEECEMGTRSDQGLLPTALGNATPQC